MRQGHHEYFNYALRAEADDVSRMNVAGRSHDDRGRMNVER
jgi:hypothetical protein